VLILSSALVVSSVPSQMPAPSQGSDVDFQQRDPSLSQYGAVDWEARWDRNVITVCWLNHPELAQQRALVRRAVSDTWVKVSSVRFTGWEDCQPSGADIKIMVDQSGPRSYVGRNAIGQSPSMWLNFTFNTWSPTCRTTIDKCISAIAAHEFGHAAGFVHEQLQPDAPKQCVDHLKQTGQWEQVGKPPTALTPYDPDSIMNYCNAIWNNNGKLSNNDVKAILILFPVS
jgi:hypothetical protein